MNHAQARAIHGPPIGTAIFLNGSTREIRLDLTPRHDPALGTYYESEDGARWRAVQGSRMAADGTMCGGPGFYEPLEDEELPEDG